MPTTPDRGLTKSDKPSPKRSPKPTPRKRTKQDSFRRSIGSIAEPGRVLSKAEREKRRASEVTEPDDQEKPVRDVDTGFSHLGQKIANAVHHVVDPFFSALNDHLGTHSASDAVANIRPHARDGNLFITFRSVLVTLLFILLVFGALQTLFDYLLLAIRATAACSTTTVFIPVTETTTVTAPCSQSPTTTLTSTSFLTNTVTMFAEVSSSATLGPYYYSMVSGTTSWSGGMSPTEGAAITTGTTSFFVSPLADTTVTIDSTVTDYETITAPAYTSTVYSFAGPALTITSTSTHYTTISLSAVSPTITTRSSSSRHGPGPGGWNTTSSSEVMPASATPSESVSTMTQIYYWGTGSLTTSTSTTHITTTVHVTNTKTLTMISTVSDLTSTSSAEASPVAGSSSSSGSHSKTTSSNVAPTPHPFPGSTFSGQYPNSTVVGPVNGSPTLLSHGTGYGYTPGSLHTSMSATMASNSSAVNGVTASMNGSSVSTRSGPVTLTTTLSSMYSHTTSASSSTVSHASHGNSTAGPVSGTKSSVTAHPSSVSSYTSGSNASVHHHTTVSSKSSSLSGALSTSSVSSSVSATYTSVASGTVPSFSSTPSGYSQQSTHPSAHATPSGNATSPETTLRTSTSTRTKLPSSVTSSSPASGTPSNCGEYGDFTLSFDDLPNFVPTNDNRTDITQAPPVPNPYHHLTFSDGYVYAPSPKEPYTPHSLPRLGVFLADGTGFSASTMKHGEIADGRYESSSVFWFDARSAWLGCDNRGPQDCTMVLTGYTWSPDAHDEVATYSQNTTIPPCAASSGCQLKEYEFPSNFRNLTGLQIQAYVGHDERMFFVDDIALTWSNNTCNAGLLRLRVP